MVPVKFQKYSLSNKVERMTISRFVILPGVAAALLLSAPVGARAGVSEYRVFTAELYSNDGRLVLIALRRFRTAGGERYLAVNPVSLRTGIVPVGACRILKKAWKDIRRRNAKLPYFKALASAEENSRRVQNAGITRVPRRGKELYLSADLCPAGLPLDRSLFASLNEEYGRFCGRVPITVAASGLWLVKHREDLKWLKGLEKKGQLSITWANHSYSHRYNRKAPWWRNFLLERDTDLESEVMKTERVMIESGMAPSVFFRFPGLVSDRKIFARVAGWGLIPLGSDAWLGKLQWPGPGSVILVHANGLEPVGIRRLRWLLRGKRKDILSGQWVLGDIRDGLGGAGK